VIHLFNLGMDVNKCALVVQQIVSGVGCRWRRVGEEGQVVIGCVTRVVINRAKI